ncbi:PREDICTED: pathogenesis-related protein PR-1-like [Fragaria vesca subsp. vesca]
MENKSFSICLVRTFLLLCILFWPSFSRSSPHKTSPTRSSNTMHQYLVPHNTERSKLGLPPLKWSKKLESYASWWARQRREDCSLIHSNSEYGENLFWGSGHDWKPSDAVRAWARESRYYNHKTNSCEQNKDCLHYTQMVWRQSSKIGCAKVVCKSGDTILACVYDPPGNVIGEKPF